MRKFILHIFLFFIPAIIGVIVLFCFKVDKNFAYHFVKGECDDKANWIYDRVFVSEKDIDVVFMGASQTACAVMDEWIENEVNKPGEKTTKVANLGYCRGGRDIQYTMLSDVFNHKKPKLLFIEVTEDEPKKSHPVFPYLADSKILFGSFVFFNQRFFTNLWKGLSVRLEFIKWKIFKNPVLKSDSLPVFGYRPSETVVGDKEMLANKTNWQKRLNREKPFLIREAEIRYSKHYVEKMVELAKEKGCKVVFLYLRESGSGLQKPLLYNFYTNQAEILLLPDPVFNNRQYWKDGTHFNDSGAKAASGYIAMKIGELLK